MIHLKKIITFLLAAVLLYCSLPHAAAPMTGDDERARPTRPSARRRVPPSSTTKRPIPRIPTALRRMSAVCRTLELRRREPLARIYDDSTWENSR